MLGPRIKLEGAVRRREAWLLLQAFALPWKQAALGRRTCTHGLQRDEPALLLARNLAAAAGRGPASSMSKSQSTQIHHVPPYDILQCRSCRAQYARLRTGSARCSRRSSSSSRASAWPCASSPPSRQPGRPLPGARPEAAAGKPASAGWRLCTGYSLPSSLQAMAAASVPDPGICQLWGCHCQLSTGIAVGQRPAEHTVGTHALGAVPRNCCAGTCIVLGCDWYMPGLA